MSRSRNLTSHTYNEETAEEIAEAIRNEYVSLLNTLAVRLEAESQGSQSDLFTEE